MKQPASPPTREAGGERTRAKGVTAAQAGMQKEAPHRAWISAYVGISLDCCFRRNDTLLPFIRLKCYETAIQDTAPEVGLARERGGRWLIDKSAKQRGTAVGANPAGILSGEGHILLFGGYKKLNWRVFADPWRPLWPFSAENGKKLKKAIFLPNEPTCLAPGGRGRLRRSRSRVRGAAGSAGLWPANARTRPSTC